MDRARRRTSMDNYRSRKFGICVSVAIFGTFIAYVMLAYTAFESPITERDTLQQLFRHGDRTPAETYAKNLYVNFDWPGGWEVLTKKGMLQLYNLGQWIRLKYGSVIGRKFENTDTLVMRSSFKNRCVMSAQALLAGLFVPAPDDMFLPGLAWTPVSVHPIPPNLDNLITVQAPCPRLEEALKQAHREEAIKGGEKMANYLKELTEHIGQNVSTIIDVGRLYSTLEIIQQNGFELPAWTQKFYNKEMRDIAFRSWAIATDGTVQKRLRGGPLIKEILFQMEECRNDPKPKRYYFYSVHGITLINMMRTIGLFPNELVMKPDYGATLILELHLVNNGADQEVKALYLNNTDTDIVHRLEIPNCASPCLLQRLKQVWYEVIPNDWDAECKI